MTKQRLVLTAVAGVAVISLVIIWAVARRGDDQASGVRAATPLSASTPSAHSSTTTSRACALLTEQEVSKAVGGKAAPGASDLSPSVDASCQWSVTGSRLLGEAGSVAVTMTHTDDPGGVKFIDFEKTKVALGQDVAVKGIGDAAYFEAGTNTLYLHQGSEDLDIEMLGYNVVTAAPAVRTPIITLGKLMAIRVT